MINWGKITLKDLAGYISEELRKADIEVILVGGACVTIYSKNQYQSYDLDFITYEEMKRVKQVLKNLGLHEKSGYFRHDDCPWLIEFVSPPLAIGNEHVKKLNSIKTSVGTIKMLTVTDSVKDRLASYYHWDDKQALRQALQVCKEQKIDLKEIETWSKKEGMRKKFEIFSSLIKS